VARQGCAAKSPVVALFPVSGAVFLSQYVWRVSERTSFRFRLESDAPASAITVSHGPVSVAPFSNLSFVPFMAIPFIHAFSG